MRETIDLLHNLSVKDGFDDSSLLRTLIDSLPEQVYVKDTEGRYVLNNIAHVRALEATSSEKVVGKSDFDFYPKELAERYRADEQEIIRSGLPLVDKEELSEDEEGNRSCHSTTKVPLRDGSGKIVGLVGITRDVTERKEAEEKLKESEERYRTVVEQSAESIWLFEPDTKQVLETNTAFQEMLGYTAEELQQMTNYDFVAHSREVIDTAVERVLREGRGFFGERRYRRKDGSLVDLEVSANVVPYRGREVMCGVAHDLTERKRAEEALRESEERFRSVFENAPIGVCLVGLDRRHLKVNRAFCEMLGYSEEELLEKTHPEIIHPDDHEISSKHLRQALEEGLESYTLERRYIHAEGHVVWNLSSVSLIQDSEGNPSHLVCLHQDITQRKEAEEKLRKSEARLAEAQRIAHLGNWEWDVKTGEVLWSDEVFRIYGYRPQEFVPTLDKLMELVHPDDRELVRKNIDAALHEGEPYDFEHRIVRPDGEERVVHRQAEVYFDEEEGEPQRMVGTVHDTTERKRAEEKLRESEKRFHSLTRNALDLITILGEDGAIRYESPAVERILGYRLEERIGKNGFDYVHPDDEEQMKETFTEALDNPGQVQPSVEFRLRHKDGSWRHMEVTRTNLLEDPAVKGVVSNSRDITERRQAEEKLRESEERYRAVVEQSAESIYLFDPETKEVLESNTALQEMLGYTAEELQGMTTYDFVAHSREDIDSTVERIVQERRGFFGERKYRRKDGTVLDVEASGTIISYKGKEVMCAVARDLTERKRAEEKLRQSEERFRTAFEDAPIGVALVGLDGRPLRVNRALCEMLGYSEEELLGKDYSMHIHPEDHEISAEHLHRTLEEGAGSYTLERRYIHADGHVVWNLSSVSLIQDSQGDLSHFVCLHQDITERKGAEEALKESEERYRTVVEQSVEGIWLFEADTKQVLESNTAFQEMLGYTAEELQQMTNYDFVAHSREVIDSAVERVLREGRGFFGERKYRRKDGSLMNLEVSANVTPYQGREVMCGVAHDLTERKRAEEALKESEERYRAVVEQSMEGIYLFDPDTKEVLESNTALQEMLGYAAEELCGMPIYDFIADEEENIDRNVQRDLREERRHKGERKYRRKDGSIIDVDANATVISYGGRDVVCMAVRDITERKELEEQLRHQAFHDSLTELPNRSLFLDRLRHALARTRRGDDSVAVLFVDLDNFKVVNDSLGHEVGNAVLIEVGKCLQACVRPGDTVGRIFGDEFAVLLEAPAGMEEASQVAERIQERLQESLEIDGHEVFLRASIGIALGRTAEDQPGEVLRHADLAMYEAKSHVNGKYEVYNPGMGIRAEQRMDLEKDLRKAVERGEFEVYYQPKVLLETGKIVGAEALVRWEHPDRGLLPPTQFVPLAEETGLIDQIGLWVLKESCHQLKKWQEQGLAKQGSPLGLCVNLSAREIQQPDLADKIAGVLQETGLDPGCLTLEISEKTTMKDAEYTLDKLHELKDLGVELALDDFGTGYCSLVYLEHSVFDALKIDRLLMHKDRENSEECATVISAMVNMAHSLGLTVIVEGVETEEQLATLMEMGCEMAQGDYFAKPLPNEALERLLAEGVSW